MYHFCNICLNYVVNVLSRISIVMFICKTFIMKFVVPLVFSKKICGCLYSKFQIPPCCSNCPQIKSKSMDMRRRKTWRELWLHLLLLLSTLVWWLYICVHNNDVGCTYVFVIGFSQEFDRIPKFYISLSFINAIFQLRGWLRKLFQ